MTDAPFPPLDIARHWRTVQEHLLRIVDLVPDDKWDWTPRDDLWNSRGILIHVADARDRWLSGGPGRIGDGEPYPNIWVTARSRDDIRREVERTFARVGRFLRNRAQLEATYTATWDGHTETYDGHWVAFHLLEHDIHHRAELMQRLALLGVEHGFDL